MVPLKGVDTMAGNTTNISIRMDTKLKAQADALFAELGMNLSTAFNIFVRQGDCLRHAGGGKDRKGPVCKGL